jgi:hypothetical protein
LGEKNPKRGERYIEAPETTHPMKPKKMLASEGNLEIQEPFLMSQNKDGTRIAGTIKNTLPQY